MGENIVKYGSRKATIGLVALKKLLKTTFRYKIALSEKD